PRSRTRGSTWSPSAASLRSAAAFSTCSRRPTSTRSGWSSGATRSRRSARSRSPTSAPSPRPTGCGRRRAGNCCSPSRSGSGPAPIDLGAAAFHTLADVRGTATGLGQAWWSVSPFGVDAPVKAPEPLPWEEGEVAEPVEVTDDAVHLTLQAQPVPLYHGETGR